LQYKNALSDPNWMSLGNFPGNDTLEPISTSLQSSNRFYRVTAN
jgi:hypothetical protein